MIFRLKKSMVHGVDSKRVADHPFWALFQLVVQSQIITDPCEPRRVHSKPCRGHVIWNDPKSSGVSSHLQMCPSGRDWRESLWCVECNKTGKQGLGRIAHRLSNLSADVADTTTNHADDHIPRVILIRSISDTPARSTELGQVPGKLNQVGVSDHLPAHLQTTDIL